MVVKRLTQVQYLEIDIQISQMAIYTRTNHHSPRGISSMGIFFKVRSR